VVGTGLGVIVGTRVVGGGEVGTVGRLVVAAGVGMGVGVTLGADTVCAWLVIVTAKRVVGATPTSAECVVSAIINEPSPRMLRTTAMEMMASTVFDSGGK
jgi:hypothetical protein